MKTLQCMTDRDFAAYRATRGHIRNVIRLGLRMRSLSEAAESFLNVNMFEDEKHDGVVLFGGSSDGSDGVDTKLYHPELFEVFW